MDVLDVLSDVAAIDCDILIWDLVEFRVTGEEVLDFVSTLLVVFDLDVGIDFVGDGILIHLFEVMGVGLELQLVIALFKFITGEAVLVRVIAVIGLEFLGVDFDFDVGLLSWLKFRGLRISDELDVALFDSAWSIGGGEIDTDDVFTGDFAFIGDSDGDCDLAIFSDGASFRKADGFEVPIEFGVGHAETEWVLDDVFVSVIWSFVPESLVVRGFKPTITDIDSFGVFNIAGGLIEGAAASAHQGAVAWRVVIWMRMFRVPAIISDVIFVLIGVCIR